MIKEFLQGKPFAHPLHPALVHFPIGLFILSLLLDITARLVGESNALVLAAFYSMVFGAVMAVLAAITGLVDWSDIRIDHPAKGRATTHMLLNLVAVGLYLANIVLRIGELDSASTPILPLTLSLVAVTLILISGYLGGTLIYNEGIAVGRHRRHSRTPDRTIRVEGDGKAGEFAPIVDAGQVEESETLRVEVGGTVMAVVKLDGQFYAFQEFCTHRYGPLSKGSFEDHQVQCPWHRSCFDVRTGKVTEGPAKVDLKTFEVAVQNGKVCVRVT